MALPFGRPLEGASTGVYEALELRDKDGARRGRSGRTESSARVTAVVVLVFGASREPWLDVCGASLFLMYVAILNEFHAARAGMLKVRQTGNRCVAMVGIARGCMLMIGRMLVLVLLPGQLSM